METINLFSSSQTMHVFLVFHFVHHSQLSLQRRGRNGWPNIKETSHELWSRKGGTGCPALNSAHMLHLGWWGCVRARRQILTQTDPHRTMGETWMWGDRRCAEKSLNYYSFLISEILQCNAFFNNDLCFELIKVTFSPGLLLMGLNIVSLNFAMTQLLFSGRSGSQIYRLLLEKSPF